MLHSLSNFTTVNMVKFRNLCTLIVIFVTLVNHNKASDTRGTCRRNTFLGSEPVNNFESCKEICSQNSECIAITFDSELRTCQAFSRCVEIEKDRCPHCLTAWKNEFESQTCDHKGLCQVRLLSISVDFCFSIVAVKLSTFPSVV